MSNGIDTDQKKQRSITVPLEAAKMLDVSRAEQVINGTLAMATEAVQKAKPGTVKRQLIPIYLKMDKELVLAGEPVDCRAGCSYCCYYHVYVSAVEVLALAEHVRSLPPPTRDRLINKVCETAKQVAPLSEPEYSRTNVPCAFLEDGRCSVYSVRPVACRGFHSINVETCKRAYEDPKSEVPMTVAPDRQAVNEGYKYLVVMAQHNAGRDATTYEMHGAVAEALINPTSIKRWKVGKVAFPDINDQISIEERMGE